ncbi:MAG TPA: MFS transporter [Stellaceae bacterium]|nr:MFS transporter [Stellaceae bacterium]
MSEGRRAAESTRGRVWIFIAALASVFMTAIEGTIVATAMPTIVAALGGFELLSWVFTAYLLTQAVTIPIYGRLADFYGRKPILLLGIGLFLVGSVLCGFAWSMLSLVAFRVVQGIGAGAVMPVGRTLIGDVYHGPERARMQGYVSSVFVGAAVIGPMVGAFLAAHTIWPMVFWINVPFGLIAAALLAWKLDERTERHRHRIDFVGSGLLGLGTGILMFALAEAARVGPAATVALMTVALVALVLFVMWEARVPEPVWPLALWRDRIVASGNAVSIALGAITMGFAAFLPAYIEGVMGRSAFIAGVTLMAMSMAGPIGAVLAGRIMLQVSYRAAAASGACLSIVGGMMMLRLGPASAAAWVMASGLFVGFGMGMNNNTYMVAIQAGSGWSQRGIATSTIVFTRILGQAIGAALFGGILNARLAGLPGGGDLVTRMLNPSSRRDLSLATMRPVLTAFDAALHLVFAIMLGLTVFVLAVGLLLPAGHGLAHGHADD